MVRFDVNIRPKRGNPRWKAKLIRSASRRGVMFNRNLECQPQSPLGRFGLLCCEYGEQHKFALVTPRETTLRESPLWNAFRFINNKFIPYKWKPLGMINRIRERVFVDPTHDIFKRIFDRAYRVYACDDETLIKSALEYLNIPQPICDNPAQFAVVIEAIDTIIKHGLSNHCHHFHLFASLKAHNIHPTDDFWNTLGHLKPEEWRSLFNRYSSITTAIEGQFENPAPFFKLLHSNQTFFREIWLEYFGRKQDLSDVTPGTEGLWLLEQILDSYSPLNCEEGLLNDIVSVLQYRLGINNNALAKQLRVAPTDQRLKKIGSEICIRAVKVIKQKLKQLNHFPVPVVTASRLFVDFYEVELPSLFQISHKMRSMGLEDYLASHPGSAEEESINKLIDRIVDRFLNTLPDPKPLTWSQKLRRRFMLW